MIHEFTIENYRSLRDAVKVDLRVGGSAPDLERYRPRIVGEDFRLPTVAAFVGPNGSGKSTVLESLLSGLKFVYESYDVKSHQHILGFPAFLNKQQSSSPTRFEFIFDALGFEGEGLQLFKYQLLLDRSDNVFPAEVLHEALFYAPKGRWKRILEHKKGEKVHLAKELRVSKVEKFVIESVGTNRSVISVLAVTFNNPHMLSLWNQVAFVLKNSLFTQDSENYLAVRMDSNSKLLEKLNSHIRRIDIGISSMQVERISDKLDLQANHDGLDFPVRFEDESKGTQRFVALFPRIFTALESGYILMVDDFDRDLHPDLAVEILSWFQSPETNPRGAQIFCTLHNTEVLNALEKEELFIVEKDREGVTHVWGAQDVKGLRRDVDLAKKYRQGALGGLPRIG